MKRMLLALLLLTAGLEATQAQIPVGIYMSGTISAQQGAPGTPWPVFFAAPTNTPVPTATAIAWPTPMPTYTAVPAATAIVFPTATTYTSSTILNWATPMPWFTPMPTYTTVPTATAIAWPTPLPTYTALVWPTATTFTSATILNWATPMPTYTTVPTATPLPTFVAYPTQIPLATPGGLVSINTPTAPLPITFAAGVVGTTPNNPSFVGLVGQATTAFTYAAVNQGITLTASGFAGALFIIPAVLTGSTLQAFTSMDYAGVQQHQTMLFYEAAGTAPTYVASIAAPAAGSQIYVMSDGAPYVILRCTTFSTGGAVYGVPTNSSSIQVGANINLAGAASMGTVILGAGTAAAGVFTQNVPIAAQAISVSSPVMTGGIVYSNFLKASTGLLTGINIQNLSGALTNTATVHLYNQTTAPAVGAGTVVDKFTCPGGQSQFYNLGPWGENFTTGIAYTLTASPLDASSDSIAAGQPVLLHFFYK